MRKKDFISQYTKETKVVFYYSISPHISHPYLLYSILHHLHSCKKLHQISFPLSLSLFIFNTSHSHLLLLHTTQYPSKLQWSSPKEENVQIHRITAILFSLIITIILPSFPNKETSRTQLNFSLIFLNTFWEN